MQITIFKNENNIKYEIKFFIDNKSITVDDYTLLKYSSIRLFFYEFDLIRYIYDNDDDGKEFIKDFGNLTKEWFLLCDSRKYLIDYTVFPNEFSNNYIKIEHNDENPGTVLKFNLIEI